LADTLYSDVFDVFLAKITDFYLGDLLASTPELAEQRMTKWLIGAIVKFTRCKKDLSNRNDTTRTFYISLTDKEIEILAYFMCHEWADPEIKNLLNLRQILGDAAFKLTSQANHLKEIKSFKLGVLEEAQYYMIQYTYDTSDPYLEFDNKLSDLG
jgi:hypothetical protein